MSANEPWWIADDRKKLRIMRDSWRGKPETAMIRYQGDMRPMTVADVRIKADELAARIEADIARFIEVGGDYDKM